MKTIFSEKLPRILKNKKRLERELHLKISNKGRNVSIKGKPEEEYYGEKVIEALNFGFPFKEALSIKKENFVFERINLKKYTTRKDLSRIRARIIGKKGKTLRVLRQLTKCFFEIKGNEVGIIGDPERIERAQEAIIALIRGSKHSNVYHFLEKHQIKPIYDLGLK